jgi:hypothetical protein
MFRIKPLIITTVVMSLLVGLALIGGQNSEVPLVVTYQSHTRDENNRYHVEDSYRHLAVDISHHPCVINLIDLHRWTLGEIWWEADVTFAAYNRTILLTDVLTGMVCNLGLP